MHSLVFFLANEKNKNDAIEHITSNNFKKLLYTLQFYITVKGEAPRKAKKSSKIQQNVEKSEKGKKK